MQEVRKYACALAVIPFLAGIDLMSGRNFYHFGGMNESSSIMLGIALEGLAFYVATLSPARWVTVLASSIMLVMSLAHIGWSVILAMFSGWGDGASSGGTGHLLMIHLGGGACFLFAAVFGILKPLRAGRSKS